MRALARRAVVGVAAVVTGLVVTPVFPASAVCREAWTDPGSAVARGYFEDVSALGPSDAWAGGIRYDRNGNERFLVAHWDGSTWTQEQLGFSPLYAQVFAIEAISVADVWAAGVYFDVPQDRTELVMFHFDGVAWSVVDSPIARSQRITDMVAFATDDVWAAGWYSDAGHYRPWVLHWDGLAWSVVDDIPDPTGEEHPQGIDGTSSTNLWVVGTTSAPDGALILHGTSAGWVSADLPSLPGAPRISDIASVSADRAFVVGHVDNGAAKLALRWNGTAWRRMPVPAGAGALQTVAAASGRDVAVVGGDVSTGAVSYRWNGTEWRRIALPDGTDGSLFEVEHAEGAWFIAGGSGRRTSVLQRCVSV